MPSRPTRNRPQAAVPRPPRRPDPVPFAADIEAIVRGRHGNPFVTLGMHGGDGQPVVVNVFAPEAAEVALLDAASGRRVASLDRVHPEGFFSVALPDRKQRFAYRLEKSAGPARWEVDDPYRFGPVLGEMDEYLMAEGRHLQLYRRLGAHPLEHEGVVGVAFAVWAPNARRVSIVGDFNAWDGRRHPMRKRLGGGVWELFVPALERGAVYKYEILGAHGELMPLKADPLAFSQEMPPATASRVCGLTRHEWGDADWMSSRAARQNVSAPVSIYEMHLGSWRRSGGDEMLDYDTIADLLVPYIEEMGFTHVELLPITEHPFSGSWGYQPLGLFAPTSRFGPPEAFARFVRPAARCRHRRHPGLGSGALSLRRARAGPLRRNRALRARGSAARLPPRLEHADL